MILKANICISAILNGTEGIRGDRTGQMERWEKLLSSACEP